MLLSVLAFNPGIPRRLHAQGRLGSDDGAFQGIFDSALFYDRKSVLL
jgi:hypothetical protein